jgi:3-hydroxypropanoate dehydrogenase
MSESATEQRVGQPVEPGLDATHPGEPVPAVEGVTPDAVATVAPASDDLATVTRAERAEVAGAVRDAMLDVLFRDARTPDRWSDRPVEPEVIQALFELVRLGPTSGNCQPARFVFLHSADSRERLRPALSAGNVEAVMGAPLCVVVAHDPLFFEQMPRLHPDEDLRSWFAADLSLSEETAFRNGTLAGGYLLMAARALGLDAWAMSGFDAQKVDDIFLAGSGWRSNFLLSLGYAAGPPARPRAPRLLFDEACMLL